jgi:hypothetical protein
VERNVGVVVDGGEDLERVRVPKLILPNHTWPTFTRHLQLAPPFGPTLAMTGDPLTPQTTWSQYINQIYMTGKRPIVGSYDHRVVEARAREVTKDNHRTFAHP